MRSKAGLSFALLIAATSAMPAPTPAAVSPDPTPPPPDRCQCHGPFNYCEEWSTRNGCTVSHTKTPDGTNSNDADRAQKTPTGSSSKKNSPTGSSTKDSHGQSGNDKPTGTSSKKNSPTGTSTQGSQSQGTAPADGGICALPLNHTDSGTLKKTWQDSGAEDWLNKFLDGNGVKDWAASFWQQTQARGLQGGTTIDCSTVTSTSCNRAPDCLETSPTEQWYKYTPAQAFFVGQSMANLHSQLFGLHEWLQDTGIKQLSNGIKDVTAKFGPPDNDHSWMFAVLIGSFLAPVTLAGPIWQAAVPNIAAVAVLNVASGLYTKNKPKTPEQFNNQLESELGDFYDGFLDSLATAVGTAFSGNFSSLPDFKGDPKTWITDLFSDGKMLDQDLSNKVTQAMESNAMSIMLKAFAVQGLKAQNYHVSQRTDYSEEECHGQSKAVWMNGYCTSIAKLKPEKKTVNNHPLTVLVMEPMDDDMFDAFTKSKYYGMNYQEAMQNAIDCAKSGSTLADQIPNIPVNKQIPAMPNCLVDLPVSVDNGNDNGDSVGWQSGSCGIHVQQQRPTDTTPAYQFKVDLKDANQKILKSTDWMKADPTVEIKGHESDKSNMLPYDFYLAAGSFDGGLGNDEIGFWYGDQYWTTEHGSCKMGDYDHEKIRSGDCGFKCSKETDNAPASATSGHPLPTSMPTYKPGWCGVHVHLERDPNYISTIGDHYFTVNADIKDDSQKVIGSVNQLKVKMDDSFTLKSLLPNGLKITPANNSPTSFDNDGTTWNAGNDDPRAKGGHECGYDGKWDEGHTQDMDCGFKC